jgi:hypothetical protein
MKKSARESASFLAAIVKFQAIIRGVSVRRGIDLFHKISSAAAKIQSAYRRYRVLKWIYNTDSSSCDILGRSTVRDHIHGNIVSDPDESLVIMDHLCGFYSPDKKETGKIKINQTITPIDLSDTPVKRAINSASPDSQVIIKAMQLEIKRLQRLISRQGPPLPIDPS